MEKTKDQLVRLSFAGFKRLCMVLVPLTVACTLQNETVRECKQERAFNLLGRPTNCSNEKDVAKCEQDQNLMILIILQYIDECEKDVSRLSGIPSSVHDSPKEPVSVHFQ